MNYFFIPRTGMYYLILSGQGWGLSKETYKHFNIIFFSQDKPAIDSIINLNSKNSFGFNINSIFFNNLMKSC